MGERYLICIAFASIVFASMVLCSLATTSCDECALLAFKSHLEFDPKNLLEDNWSMRTSYCNWVGVSCGRGRRRVTGLNLPNMGLSGTVAPHMGNLSYLTNFNISFNGFHGQLPDEIGRLRRLKLIDIQHNQFTGSVPASLGLLPNLQSLILSFNNFNGTIPTTLCNISNLESLGLPGNRICGNIPAEIEPRSKGNAERANGILQGKRLLMSLNRQEECKNCHDMAGAEGDATPVVKGEEAVKAQQYREPVRPSHSSSPDHSDQGKSSGKPPL